MLWLNNKIEEVKAFYHEKEERMESMVIQIQNEKVIEWLKSKAVIEGERKK